MENDYEACRVHSDYFHHTGGYFRKRSGNVHFQGTVCRGAHLCTLFPENVHCQIFFENILLCDENNHCGLYMPRNHFPFGGHLLLAIGGSKSRRLFVDFKKLTLYNIVNRPEKVLWRFYAIVNDIRNFVFGLAGATVYGSCKSRKQKFVMSFTIILILPVPLSVLI